MKHRLIALFLAMCFGSTALASGLNRVLVISSYGTDYQWSNEIIDGINYKVNTVFPGVELNVEYLSSEMFTNTDNWLRRMEIILQNYNKVPPLAIVLISDEAWMAYRGSDTEALKDVPIILCAVKPHTISVEKYTENIDSLNLGDFTPTKMAMHNYNATGVLRRMNIEGYLQLMHNVIPDVDSFIFVTDKRFYGIYTQLLVKEQFSTLYPQDKAQYINSLTSNTNVLVERLSQAKQNTGVLLTSWLTGEHGYEYSRDYIYKHMYTILNTPIFITNDIGLHNGYFLGGLFNEAAFWGEKCGDKLLSVIKGEKANTIPTDTYDDTQCHIDWRIMDKYKIDKGLFPDDTIFHNVPESLVVKYRNYIIAAGFILSLIILLLAYVIRSHLRLRKAQKMTLLSARQANESNEHLRETRRNLTVALEKAEESDRLKSAFIANMSHEIRTPLNAIVGFSSIIATTESERERLEFADIIQKNSDLLLQLISDILNISKLEAGTQNFSYENVDASSICMDIVVAYQSRCNPNVELRFNAPKTPLNLYTDANHIIQILTNFALNAIKFTHSGSIEIGYLSYDNELVEFYVSDTGIGIESDKLSTIFDRFVKLNNYVEGTGLGLALCKTIIDLLGGEIGVESKSGEGSRFWFRIKKRMD